MSKKTMMLALAVAALFALPSAASAQERHIKGITTFTGTSGAGALTASGEPTITTTASSVYGTFDTGSATTGTINFALTGSRAEFLGATPSCNSPAEVSGVITMSGTFHVIKYVQKTVSTPDDNLPAVLFTPSSTTIICAGFSNLTISGSVIGLITSPACGGSSTTLKLQFTSSGSTQGALEYTGFKYDLLSQTGSGSKTTAGLNAGTVTLTSSTAGTLECT